MATSLQGSVGVLAVVKSATMQLFGRIHALLHGPQRASGTHDFGAPRRYRSRSMTPYRISDYSHHQHGR